MYKLLVILFIIKLYARNSVKLLLRLPLMTNLNWEILEILKCLRSNFNILIQCVKSFWHLQNTVVFLTMKKFKIFQLFMCKSYQFWLYSQKKNCDTLLKKQRIAWLLWKLCYSGIFGLDIPAMNSFIRVTSVDFVITKWSQIWRRDDTDGLHWQPLLWPMWHFQVSSYFDIVGLR